MPATGTTDFRSTYCKCSRQELCKHSFLPGNRKFSSAGPLFVPTRKANAKAFPVCRRVPSIRPDPQTIKGPAAPKRNSPARAPGHTVFAIQDAKIGGLRRGRSRRGRFGGTGLSLRGGSLQGLPLWRNFQQRGACAGEGLAGGPPRDRPLREGLPGGAGTVAGGCKCPKEFFRRTAMDSRPSAYLKNTSAPKRNSPARAPGHTVFAIQDAKIGGLCRGRSRRGRFGGTGLSLRGGSLQGLLLWRKSLPRGPCAGEAGLSQVFSQEKNSNCEKSIDKTMK